MKLAVLMLCHKNPEQINLFLDVLYHKDIEFFIHIDKKSNIAGKIIKRGDVFLLPENKRVLTKWGSVSLVEATLNLLECAYKKGKYDYFWLCSGQDFPLKSADEIVAFLEKNNKKEFLSLFPSKQSCGKNTNYDKRTTLYFPEYVLGNSFLQRFLKRLYIEFTGGYNKTFLLKRKNNTGLNFYFGSQWWCLSGLMIQWILDYIKQKPEFLAFYKNAIVPDESFFHTLVMNSPYAKNRCDALHYIDWSIGGNSPKTLTITDLTALEESDKLMARKFDIDQDKKILEILSKKQGVKVNTEPTRVLQIVSTLGLSGGVNMVIMNWYRNINRNKVQFDFLYCKGAIKETFNQEIEQMGGHCYELPSPKNPFKFLKAVYKFFKNHHYKTIHSHITNLNIFFFPFAKMFGTKNIIQHSHGTKWSDKKLNGLRNYLMLHAVWPLISYKIACSSAAGKAYFGKDFIVANNGIDINRFIYNSAVRKTKRKELGLENNFIVGNIGRFNLQKNHEFLIRIFEEVAQKDETAVLVLVGSGPLQEKIKTLVAEKNLQDRVLFLGVRKDVVELYQSFDVLCMPSFYEGLPVVGVEAQGSGLPCVFADTITKEVLLLPDSKMLSLKDSPQEWAKVILSLKDIERHRGKDYLKQKGFDIKDVSKQMEDFYDSI